MVSAQKGSDPSFRGQAPTGFDLTAKNKLLAWLTESGFPSAQWEIKERLLILRLDASNRRRLLADANLRQRLVDRAKALGFSRVALRITPA